MLEEPVIEEQDADENAPALTTHIENINKVTRALYIYKKPASYKELAGPSGLPLGVASQGLSSSKDLGITKSAGKKGWYLLSSEGVEYGRFLTENRIDECKSLLKGMIIGSSLWADVISFLRTSEGVARNPIDLVMSAIEKKLGKQWSPKMRRTVSDSIASVLDYSGIAKKESGKIISLIGPNEDMPSKLKPPATFTSSPKAGSISAVSGQVTQGFYEIAGDGFYLKIKRDPSAIAEAYDHLSLIMKRNSEQRSPVSEAKSERTEAEPPIA